MPSLNDVILMLAGLAAVVAFVLGLMWVTGNLDDTPAERAGFADPPPTCERGELPRRIYLSHPAWEAPAYVMTCAVREVGPGEAP